MKPQAVVLQLSCVALAVSGIADARILGFDNSDEFILIPTTGSSKTSACLKSCISHVAHINEGLCDHTTKVGCICSSPHPNVVRNQVVSCMQNCPSMESKDVYLAIIAYNEICKSVLTKQNSPSSDMAIGAFSIDNVERYLYIGQDINFAQLKKKRQEAPPPGEIPPIPPSDPPDPDPQDPDPQDPDPQNPDPQDPDPQVPDPQNPDPQDPDPQNPDPQNPDPQEPDPQDPDPQDPDPQDPDPQDPDPQDPDPQDTDPQDPDPQNPDPQDPDPQDPDPQDPDPQDPDPQNPNPQDPDPQDPGTPTPGTPTPGTPTPGTPTPGTPTPGTPTRGPASSAGSTGGKETASGSHTFSTVTTSRPSGTQAPIVPINNNASLMAPISISMLLIATSFVFLMSG